MEVSSPSILRSLTHEAGRQADFYNRRTGTEAECQFWSDLEAIATAARHRSAILVIEMRDRLALPIPIKGCEQAEQPPILHVIKAFQ